MRFPLSYEINSDHSLSICNNIGHNNMRFIQTLCEFYVFHQSHNDSLCNILYNDTTATAIKAPFV